MNNYHNHNYHANNCVDNNSKNHVNHSRHNLVIMEDDDIDNDDYMIVIEILIMIYYQ